MLRRLGHRGVTLIELLIVMGIITLVITASSKLLATMLTQFKQQTKIAETSIESLVGLEILRNDLFGVGFGLAHQFQNPISYNEADGLSPATLFDDAPNSIPRAFIANRPAAMINNSYYLVVKSLMVVDDPAAGKYHFLFSDENWNSWSPNSIELKVETDRILVYYFNEDEDFTLAMDGAEWRPGGSSTGQGTLKQTNIAALVPSDSLKARIIYGVNSDPNVSKLRFPFNRADYYITNGTAPYASDTLTPERCAPGSGVLVKAILNHQNGKFDYDGDNTPEELPIMDCVLDVQVGIKLNTGVLVAAAPYLDDKSAGEVRTEVKEIRVYILAHEGQFDPTYEQPSKDFYVGEQGFTGRSIDLEEKVGEDWSRYRWRLYTLVVQPEALNAAPGI